jgi:hypothetical protein
MSQSEEIANQLHQLRREHAALLKNFHAAHDARASLDELRDIRVDMARNLEQQRLLQSGQQMVDATQTAPDIIAKARQQALHSAVSNTDPTRLSHALDLEHHALHGDQTPSDEGWVSREDFESKFHAGLYALSEAQAEAEANAT